MRLSCSSVMNTTVPRSSKIFFSLFLHISYSSLFLFQPTISKSFLLPNFQSPTASDNMSNNSPSVSAPIIQFYDPNLQGKDFKGRTLSEILSWNDAKLESCHNYIQTLFPLPEPSPFSRSAPVIDREVFEAFRSRPELRAQLRKSLERMLHFYGFNITPQGAKMEEVRVSPPVLKFDDRPWLGKFNHNHLRITRILRCLRVLGLDKEAELFFAILKNVGRCTKRGNHLIGEESMQYWRKAAKRPLYLAPDDLDDEGRGKDFLYEYEESKKIKPLGEGEPEPHTNEATSSSDNDAGDDKSPKPTAEQTQTPEVPATVSNSTNFSNQDPAKASRILDSAAGYPKSEIEDSDDDLYN